MRIEKPLYEVISTAFGPMGIVWWNSTSGPRVRQTFLWKGRQPVEKIIQEEYPTAQRLASPAIADLGDQIVRFLGGEALTFNLERIALEVCGLFQQKVLMAEYRIPRGWVSTYGRIAKQIGIAGGGRAVGRALAKNPFPIIIPCHRAVRTDGAIGGYQGGNPMKHALLEMEGVEFVANGKVCMKNVFY
jgi:methylated-DNA-[protein]-cysteine S-methyltransferase